MEYLFISLLAGFLTILSPCVIVVLPVILGSSLTSGSRRRALIIIASLSVSIILFTLLLKASTLLIMVPPQVWTAIAGFLILGFGIVTLFPRLWDWINVKLGLSSRSDNLLHKAGTRDGVIGSVLIGMSLGPVFSSCSPTYTVILATILPQSFAVGLINLLVYTLGMAVTLLAIAWLGQDAVKRLRWLANPDGTFKKSAGCDTYCCRVAYPDGCR
ncbi:MAG: Cytochrome C biogenesis protein transmembrane region [candidate division WS6 bacterium OLB20]|uniref:Cytochrome C biogenesis protein transmembrane region n=1 Tax=candidate division WS6 bacterium OLB20 TaxID=1617426 RepID=A0A136LWN5_9BACT|nr:MAG: Cytochrome C biogenesis protein transmembrane region [candidate division WS6 bacterium OLB20]